MSSTLRKFLPKQRISFLYAAVSVLLMLSLTTKLKSEEGQVANISNTNTNTNTKTSTIEDRSANSLISIPYYSQYQGQAQQNYDCGPADVAMVLQAYNKRTGGLSDKDWIIEVRNRSGKSSGNTSFGNLETALSSYGISSSEIAPTLSPSPDAQMNAMKNALNSNKPVIALVHGATLGRGDAYGDHFVIVRGFSDDGQSVYVNDPDQRCSNSAGNWLACGGQQTWSYSLFRQAANEAQYGPYGIIIGDGLGVTPPPSTDCNNVGSYNGIRLYDGDACNGSHLDFSSPAGLTSLVDPGWNDRANSIYVGSGWSTRVYENADGSGGSACMTENKWDLDIDHYENGATIGHYISAVKIYHNSGCTEIVNPPSAPSLSSPNNGSAIGEGQSINLQWSATGSEYYGEVWGGPGGTLTFGWQGGTSKDIGSQWPGYTYSWHVKARNSGGESGWSDTWTFTVQGDDNYEQNDTLATAWYPGYKWDNRWLSTINGYGKQSDEDWYRIDVDSGSASVKIDCNFTHSQGNIDISLYNSSGSLIAGSGNIIDNEHINYASPVAGTYYIKVFYANAGNTYDLWWDDIPVALPSAPTLTSPNNGSTIGEGQSINLQWSATGSEYYGEVWGGPGGTLTFDWQGATSKDIGSQWPGYTYSWHIKARNSSGESGWSSTWTFTVQNNDDNYEQNDTLATAWYPGYKWDNRWLSSINGYGKQSDEDWYKIDVASGSERVKVDCTFTHSQGDIDIDLFNSSGTSVAWSEGTVDNEHINYASPAAGTYYIKVNYANAGNTYDLWWDDIPVALPSAPTLTSPASGSTIGEGQSINLQWSATGSEYYGEIWGGPGGTLTFGWQGGTSKDIGSQWPGYTYSWHVKARNAGGESGWSSTWTFTVQNADDNYEQNDTLATAWYPGYKWDNRWLSSINGYGKQSDEDWYKIDVASGSASVKIDCNFTHSQGDIDINLYNSAGVWLDGSAGTVDNEHLNYASPAAGTYYIKVNYANAGNTYDLWWDDVAVTGPSVPVLVSPGNNSTHNDLESMVFNWSASSGATAYYGHLTGGPSIDINTGWITGTSWSIGKMWPGTYQWQVKAKNATGESAWSATWTVVIAQTCQTYSYNGVTLFTDTICTGVRSSFNSSTGIINASSIGLNDSISSVYVNPAWSVKVYSEADGLGSSRCLTGSMWDLSIDQYDGGGYIGDSISSVQVFNNNSCALPSANNAQFISQSVPATMVIGKVYSVSVVMKNTGNIAWKQTQNYRLGAINPYDNNTWGTGRVNLGSGQVINPGVQKTFTFNVTAPVTTGTYNFQWRMLKEGVEWFGDSTTNLQISVVNNPPTMVASPTPVNGAVNQKVTLALKWGAATDPDGHPVRYDVYLGTSPTSLSAVVINLTTKSYTFSGNGLTTYYWKVVAKDSYGASTSGPIWSFTTMNDIIPVYTGWYQETDVRLRYAGTWSSVSNASASGGTYKQTGTKGNYMEFKISGNSFTLRRMKASDRGTMLVCIDGTATANCQSVNNYSAGTKWQQQVSFTATGAGPHTIRIIDNQSKKLDIDAIKVF